jgi:hypothetical protein
MASRAGLAPASVVRVFALLEREAIVTRDERRRVVEIDRLALRSIGEPRPLLELGSGAASGGDG